MLRAKNPLVTLELEDQSRITMELMPDVAPNTVNSFINLVQKGFYHGLVFHRVIPGFMVQGGCPEGSGTGGPGYHIRGEFQSNGHANSLRHQRGVVSMARAQHPDSAGSQFFIMVADAPHLDGNYAAFGQVISGMKAVDRITALPRDQRDRPLSPPVIARAGVELFDTSYPEPEVIRRS